MSVTTHRKSSWRTMRRIELVLISARLPLTAFLTMVAWLDGHRGWAILGMVATAGLVWLTAEDLRSWYVRRPLRRGDRA